VYDLIIITRNTAILKKIWCDLCCRDEEEGYGEGDDDDPLSRRRKKKKYVNVS